MIIGIVTGGIIIIIIIAVTVACIMKKKNDRSKSNKDAFLWDNNPTIQKEVIIYSYYFYGFCYYCNWLIFKRDRGSSRGNQSTTDDRIVAPNNQYENEQSVPSHSVSLPTQLLQISWAFLSFSDSQVNRGLSTCNRKDEMIYKSHPHKEIILDLTVKSQLIQELVKICQKRECHLSMIHLIGTTKVVSEFDQT